MSERKRVKYFCQENDNHIIVESSPDRKGEIDQLLIGNPLSEGVEDAEGWTVVGMEDLREALALFGYGVAKGAVVASTHSDAPDPHIQHLQTREVEDEKE